MFLRLRDHPEPQDGGREGGKEDSFTTGVAVVDLVRSLQLRCLQYKNVKQFFFPTLKVFFSIVS